MPKLHIRKMRQQDVPLVHAIEWNAYPVPWSSNNFVECLQQAYPSFVMLCDSKIVGYIIWHLVVDEYHLLNICVAPQYQRRHIGTKLLNFLFEEAKQNNIAAILLEVRESNTAARHLYQALGFQQLAIRKNYYRNPEGREDALLMHRII